MKNIIKKYEDSFKENSELPALTNCTSGKTYSYLQLAAKVSSLHDEFAALGVAKGDKIALIGKNSIEWISVYIAIITYGAVVVPILSDFNPIDMVGIIRHSDSRLLFADKAILAKLGDTISDKLIKTQCLEDIEEPDYDKFDIESLKFADVDDEDLMIISYTSGTTGSSKGVMIPVRSITNNVDFALSENFHFRSSRVLALLPLAHAYGCAFDMLTPLSTGSHIWVLGKIPSPKLMIEALGQIKPHLICTVPLVMEKIVRKNVFPKISSRLVRTLLHIPFINNIIYHKIGKELYKTFGGEMIEMNMGGAALAQDVEKFLRKIHFPFTVGYGMTEAGPLISYSRSEDYKSGSCGTAVTGMEIRIDSENGKKIGEVCTRGTNVMLGYYKNPEATDSAIQNGWLHTGDMGFLDSEGFLYLRGRSKTMILNSSGQNIYPEEIEGKLNNLEGVGESLVYEDNGKLFAIVVPDADFLKKVSGDFNAVKDKMKENLVALNAIVAPYEKISEIKVSSEPFEKTPKQSIRRFLYPKGAKIVN